MDAFSMDAARAEVEPLVHRRGALLPMLHALQRRFGHVPLETVPMVADLLNWSQAEVHGVVSFYSDFRTAPPVGPSVRVCRSEACQAVGADALWEHAQVHGGRVQLDHVYCLGNCALGPSVQVGGRLHGRVDAARLDSLVAELVSEVVS